MCYNVENGIVSYTKEGTKYKRYIESLIQDQGSIFFSDISTYDCPLLINAEVLKKYDYFTSFPHLVGVITSYNSKIVDKINCISLNNDTLCYPSSTCHRLYHNLENQQVGNQVIYLEGTCYRNEDFFDDLKRLKLFTQNEYVFIGNKDFVIRCLEMATKLAFEIFKKLNITYITTHKIIY